MKQRRQNDEVEELVRERTHGLEETSAALELDVAARERSEKLLHESEHRFRSLTELSIPSRYQAPGPNTARYSPRDNLFATSNIAAPARTERCALSV
ncbi:MAG: hypothetical protein AUG50_09035 [Betaproteobacteria bacterium 13_1_20CM_3_63_8]|nr:MAG: hypothetical protein AUG50_09035 [Betaproteobacteria bacterium 13_1_20CM_3_63_8]